MDGNGNTIRGAWEALGFLILHPIGYVLLGAVAWLVAFAYAAGGIKQEVANLRADVMRIEAKVDQALSSYPYYPAPAP